MRTIRAGLFAVGVAAALFAVGCAGGPEASVLSGATPLSSPALDEQLVWVGNGTAYVYQDEGWVRTPESDYEFLVRQNRFSDHWESLKVQNRTHPDYDGSAGPADQQHFFLINYGPESGGRLPVTLRSTYGDGSGVADPEYREAVLEFSAAGVSRFAPYNRFRITQHYVYEEGRLEETVELFKLEDDGTESPFVRIEERAIIFRRR
jgi:hypothetical protein